MNNGGKKRSKTNFSLSVDYTGSRERESNLRPSFHIPVLSVIPVKETAMQGLDSFVTPTAAWKRTEFSTKKNATIILQDKWMPTYWNIYKLYIIPISINSL